MTKQNVMRENEKAVAVQKIGPVCQFIDARLRRHSHSSVEFTIVELAKIFHQADLSDLAIDSIIAKYQRYQVIKDYLPVDVRNLNNKSERVSVVVTKLTFWKKAETVTC